MDWLAGAVELPLGFGVVLLADGVGDGDADGDGDWVVGVGVGVGGAFRALIDGVGAQLAEPVGLPDAPEEGNDDELLPCADLVPLGPVAPLLEPGALPCDCDEFEPSLKNDDEPLNAT